MGHGDSLDEVLGDNREQARPRPVRRVVSRGLGAMARPAVAAIVTWLIAMPVAFLTPKVVPFQSGMGGLRWLTLPLTAGFFAAVVLWLAWRRWPTGWLAGVSAGAMSGWFALSLSTALRGTPFPFYGLIGDAGRITAMATRYSVTAASSDMMIPGLPSEYPPLFPWVVGRTAAMFGVAAWRLVGDFEVLFMSLAMLVAFVLWQRLVSPWLALAVATAGFMVFPLSHKAYEALALAGFLPWLLLTFTNPPRGRLHWLPSGIIAGLIVLCYYGWMIFGVFGVLVIAWRMWRIEGDRKAFLLYVAKVAGVAFVVASWFLVPLIYTRVTLGGSVVADLYGTSSMLDAIFPFLQITYPAVSGLLAMVQLIGLIGLIWLRGRAWWARPLLAMVLGAYAFRLIGMVSFMLTEHTLLSQYTPAVYGTAMSVAAPLTIAHATPMLLRRLSIDPPKPGIPTGVAAGVAVMLSFAGYVFCVDWMPKASGGRYSIVTEFAYGEPYPTGGRPSDAAQHTPWFPVEPIRQAVEEVIGADHDAVALSVDERLWAYLPWRGYIGNDLWSSIAHSHQRLRNIQDLSAINDPARFTEQSQHMQFGRIDIFILKKTPQGWLWVFHRGYNHDNALIYFQPTQFDHATWAIVDVPEDYVAIVRRTAHRKA